MLKKVSVLVLAALVFVSAMLSGCGFMKRFSEAFVEEAAKQAQGSPEPADGTARPGIAASGEIDAGIWNRNTYTNKFAGLTYTLPGVWSRENSEELAEKNRGVSLSFNGTEYVDELLEGGPVYLAYAEDGKGASAYLMLRRLLAAEQGLSDSDFLRRAIWEENAVSGAYATENDGVLDMVTLCGEKYYVLTAQVFSVENGQKTAHAWNATALRRLGDTLVKICAAGASRKEAVARLEDFNGEKAQAAPAAPRALDAGKWDGKTYTNSYLGLTFTLRSGWNRSPDSTVTGFNGGRALPLDGTGDAEAMLRENGAVVVLVLETEPGGAMGYVAVRAMSAKEKAMDDESFLETVKESFNTDETSLIPTPGMRTMKLGGLKYCVSEGQLFENAEMKKYNMQKYDWNLVAITRTDRYIVQFQCLARSREEMRSFLYGFSTTHAYTVGV